MSVSKSWHARAGRGAQMMMGRLACRCLMLRPLVFPCYMQMLQQMETGRRVSGLEAHSLSLKGDARLKQRPISAYGAGE